jgi:hypothetical protein
MCVFNLRYLDNVENSIENNGLELFVYVPKALYDIDGIKIMRDVPWPGIYPHIPWVFGWDFADL